MAATNAALKQAKAEVIATRRRHALLEKMAEKKEKAIAAFVERWQKKEMAKIDKAMSSKKSKA
jgi:ribosomal protein S21